MEQNVFETAESRFVAELRKNLDNVFFESSTVRWLHKLLKHFTDELPELSKVFKDAIPTRLIFSGLGTWNITEAEAFIGEDRIVYSTTITVSDEDDEILEQSAEWIKKFWNSVNSAYPPEDYEPFFIEVVSNTDTFAGTANLTFNGDWNLSSKEGELLEMDNDLFSLLVKIRNNYHV